MKIECVDSLICDVALPRNEVALLTKPNFLHNNAAKTGCYRNRVDSSSKSQSNSGKKKESQRIRFGTYSKKTKSF